MSTRSIVAAEFGEADIRGVYVHSDGYPDGKWGKLNVLSTLITRDGVEKVIKKILGKPNGWSNLDPDQERDSLTPGYQDGRFLTVPGYGVQYSIRKMNLFGRKDYRQGDMEYRRPGDGGEEFFYIINRNGTISWCEGDWPVVAKNIQHFDPKEVA